MKTIVYNQQGQEVERLELPAEIFGLEMNAELVKQAATAHLANSRQSLAHTKDRSEVRGGGKKPWRQKGTGRARHGSIRSPLWAGGGVTFGPRKEKDFAKKINKKMKRQALLTVLSGKAKDGEITVVQEIKLAAPKTKEMAKVIKDLSAGAGKDFAKGTKIIMAKNDEVLVSAVRNLPRIETLSVKSLNINDLLSRKHLILIKEAIEVIKQTYGAI
jgi:large subunit ribosomal protein L4